MRRNMATVLVLVGVLAGAAAGDKLTINGNVALPIDRVVGFKDGEVVYTTASGTERSRRLSEVMLIAIDGQDMFNQAEQLRAEKKGVDAAGAYETVAAGGDTPAWLGQISRYRKVDVLGKDKAIATAVTVWLEIVATDVSTEAITLLPRELPDKGDPQNAQAISALKGRMGGIKSDLARQEARKLLVQLYRREGLDDEADKVAGGTAKAGTEASSGKAAPTASGGSDVAPARSGDDAGRTGAAQGTAGGLIRPNQKASVLKEQVAQLEAGLPKYIAAELGPALVQIGKGKLYLALLEKADSPDRKPLLVEAGLALMRAKTAAAAGKTSTAAEALLLAGQVNEQLGNTQAAEKAYGKVVDDYKADKTVKDIVADAQLAREKLLQKKPG
ncbi:MAG: hypothetical protein NT031_14005 [Planctomycetota bacterium]|nr:hypothetical protein [Planctomycetota bacterium]